MDPIKEKYIAIAKMMGWWQEEGHHQDTWFKRFPHCISVANEKPLQFDRDPKQQLEVLTFIEKLGYPTNTNYSPMDRLYRFDIFSDNIGSHCITSTAEPTREEAWFKGFVQFCAVVFIPEGV